MYVCIYYIYIKIHRCCCYVILIPAGALDPDTNRSMAEPCKVSPPVSPPPKTLTRTAPTDLHLDICK